MLKYHTSRDGRRILIAQMNDGHLRNTIKLYLRRAIEVRQAVTEAKDDDISELDRRLYMLPSYDAQSGSNVISEAIERLYPYLAEAFLRGTFDDLRADLAIVAGREHALADPGCLQLPPPEEE